MIKPGSPTLAGIFFTVWAALLLKALALSVPLMESWTVKAFYKKKSRPGGKWLAQGHGVSAWESWTRTQISWLLQTSFHKHEVLLSRQLYLFMDLGEKVNGLSDPKYQSIAGFSQNGTWSGQPWAQGRSRAGFHAGRPGQLGQQPKWHYRHSSEPSHQLHNKVITGLGIKLVTCVIILLRTSAERAF